MPEPSTPLDVIVDWARSRQWAALGAELVPGATPEERSSLAAIGGLVRAVTTKADRRRWPEAVINWCEDGPTPPDAVVNAVEGCLTETDDSLAALYETLVAGPNRRQLGTFFTPPRVVDFMLARSVDLSAGPDAVIDPGAGVGAFSVAASRRWPSAAVTAVDLNVVTLGLLGLRCARAGAASVSLVHSDYLSWVSGRGTASGRTLLVGNPPYTRHQELDKKLRDSLTADASRLIDSGLAGLSAYFLAASLTALGPRDSLCFVLPGSWTEARYGRAIRQWLWNAKKRRVELHAFPAPLEVFTGTKVTSMVLCVGPERRQPADFTVYRTSIRRGFVETSDGQRKSRTKEPPSSFGPWLWKRAAPVTQQTVPLSDIAKVRRGVATGANHFFFLTDEQAKSVRSDALKPAVRRLRHVSGHLLTQALHDEIGREGHPRWLLWLADQRVAADPVIRKMICDAETNGVSRGHLVSKRSPWYVVEDVAAPHLLIALMSKADIRAVVNEAGVVPSNSMYGIYLNHPDQAAAVCSWLNSEQGQLAIKSTARHYGGGLLKLEPRCLLAMRVPRQYA